MDLDIVESASGNVIRVTGDIDMGSSPKLREQVMRLLRTHSGTRLVINLEGVAYMDSSGVASLIEGLRAARKSHAELKLACLNEGPREVLELTRLLDLFDVRETEADALAT